MNALITPLVHGLLVPLATDGPEPADVKAGWTAFVVFLLLLVAVALLGWSLSRQLKKADRAKRAGVLPSTREQARLAAEQRAQGTGPGTAPGAAPGTTTPPGEPQQPQQPQG
jgi:hypothetical protein